MQPFQQRVIDERSELDQKIKALDAFTHGEIYKTLPPPEKADMAAQLHTMRTYSYLLASRIARFTSP